MPLHPALEPGRVAVITGAASGIGLAAAEKFASLGMKVVMSDVNAGALEAAEAGVTARTARTIVRICIADVSAEDEVARLRDFAFEEFGEVAVLMNNAGVERRRRRSRRSRKVAPRHRGESLGRHPRRAAVRAGDDQAKRTPSAIVNTGSKQGITCPPGDTAYNVSKAGIKVVTEALAHELRNIEGCKVSAHLLIPGFTFTGLTAARAEKPAGAWTAEQVVDFLVDLRPGRLLHPLPRQRSDARGGREGACCGRRATSSRTARRCRAGIPITRPLSPSSPKTRRADRAPAQLRHDGVTENARSAARSY